MHDCTKCDDDTRSICPLVSIAPWLNEEDHEEEATQAKCTWAKDIAKSCHVLSQAMDMSPSECRTYAVDVAAATVTCFLLGYHAGRQYQDVPEVIKQEYPGR